MVSFFRVVIVLGSLLLAVMAVLVILYGIFAVTTAINPDIATSIFHSR
jgi:hypothetical protein